MVLGLAVRDAVGAAGGGGGGGGGGAVFFLQAPSIMTAPNANTSMTHFILCCFTFCPPYSSRVVQARMVTGAFTEPRLRHRLEKNTKAMTSTITFRYLKLQFGCVLLPLLVNCR